VKSNPDDTLLRWLKDLGVNFDCASGREINEVLRHGGSADRIIFANPVKTDRDMLLAEHRNIRLTVVDSVEEVDKIYELRTQLKWQPDVLIRLAADDNKSRSPFSIKFGAERWAWQKILQQIAKRGLKFGGLSFHIGSACADPEQWGKAIDLCREFSTELRQTPRIIDIGGGFIDSMFEMAATSIRSAQKRWKDIEPPKQWIAEPGRFFSGPSHTLYSPIIGKKRGPGGNGWRYTLDESIYGQFSCIPFDHARPHWIHFEGDRNKILESTHDRTTRGFLFGRTCDSLDMIAYSEKMPNMNVGDWLCFPGMGAYTCASASEFNGFPLPFKYYKDEGWVCPRSIISNNDIIFPVETQSSVRLSLQ
jgi:ornithine decarboxylase